MNVDVKNSWDKLFTASECIQSLLSAKGQKKNISEMVVNDTIEFIRIISTAGADKRVDSFKKIYLDEEYKDLVGNRTSEKNPDSFRFFCNLEDLGINTKINVPVLMISFFRELGKYYSSSKCDKNEIDVHKFTAYIKTLSTYITSHTEKSTEIKKVKSGSCGCENTTKESDKNNKKSTVASVQNIEENEPEETLEELQERLNNMVGLAGVKQEVNSLVNLIKINKIRESRGFKTNNVSKHLVFLGNPGTGKTTIARLISKIYKQLGVLEKGQMIEVDRAGLVAGFVGQTALKTKEKIDEAMGGILFIDEAYTLAKGSSDFGQEAIDIILKAMEDNRENFVVIVAGYPAPMEEFLKSNPGLKSRFNKSIFFDDYTQEELFSIFESFLSSHDMRLSSDATEYLRKYLKQLCTDRPENFANGREMRNLFETAVSNQANRLARLSDITDEELNEITVADFKE